jgi:short-subunit dehydrogenase
MRLEDAVVLVTGSSRGIGAAIACRLAQRGAAVVLHGRDVHRLAAVGSAVGAKALAVDLCEEGAAERLAEQATQIYGRVDGVVHCAGVGWYGELWDMSAEDVDRILTVNLQAPAQLTRCLLPGMIRAGRGHVAFIGSIAGMTGVTRESVYSASKAGVLIFADSLRLELASTGVGVSVISPAAVNTEFWTRRGAPYQRAVPHMISPERVAALAVRDIERGHPGRVVPRWLKLAAATHTALPRTYHRLALAFGG